MTTIVLIWVFSSVLAWPFVGWFTSMGETQSPDIRKIVRHLGFAASLICLVTSLIVAPHFYKIMSPQYGGILLNMFANGFGFWALVHVSGAIYNVLRYLRLMKMNNL